MILFKKGYITSLKHKEKGYIDCSIESIYDDCKNLEEIKYLDNKAIVECDYCGRKITRYYKVYTKNSRIINNKVSGYSNNNFERVKGLSLKPEYPFTNDSCKDCKNKKERISNFIKYGSLKNPNRINNLKDHFKHTNGIPASRPQIYLAQLLNGKINEKFEDNNGVVGFVDIELKNDNVIIEYDGSGHRLGTVFGDYTYEEKEKDDFERDMKMRSLGYRVIRIESEKDLLPKDNMIIKQINDIIKYFNDNRIEFYRWIIPNNKKDKRYGELRTISKDDVIQMQ